MRIDAHQHVWDLSVRPQPWADGLDVLHRSFSLADVDADRVAAGVDGVVLVHALASYPETLELLALAEDHAEVVGVVGWFDLTGDVPAQLRHARSSLGGRWLVGARHQLQIEPDKAWLARVDVRAGLAVLADEGLAYDIVVAPDQLPQVLDTVLALPQLRFILDHAGKPPIGTSNLDLWRTDVSALAECPNVAVKLSGLATEADWASWTPSQLAPVVAHLLAVFGPQRCLFGSDWPVCLLAASYAQVVDSIEQLTVTLPAADQNSVWSGSARHWYRLAST